MSPESLWLAAGQSSEDAAMTIESTSPRSAVSRFYFAAFAAVHAILLARGQVPPTRGNWSHEHLGETLESVLARGPDPVRTRDARLFKRMLVELYSLRIEADYGPLRTVSREASGRARRLAGPLVRLAERMVPQ